MPDRHIFLIGMQGCGKSSLGKRVARETGMPFADTDAIVAQSIGGTVNDFFAQYGEEQFRRAETGALVLLTRMRPTIIWSSTPCRGSWLSAATCRWLIDW